MKFPLSALVLALCGCSISPPSKQFLAPPSLAFAVRVSGDVQVRGGDAPAALEAVDAAALCAAITADSGVRIEPMGAGWQPGGDQTASCWDMELGVR